MSCTKGGYVGQGLEQSNVSAANPGDVMQMLEVLVGGYLAGAVYKGLALRCLVGAAADALRTV